jgi:hypothetical protein
MRAKSKQRIRLVGQVAKLGSRSIRGHDHYFGKPCAKKGFCALRMCACGATEEKS